MCNACAHIDKLDLKVIVHSGEALLYQIGNFFELSGVDVITVHRLLKNSVPGNQYLLMTEPAYRDIEFSETIQVAEAEEVHDIGVLKTYTHFPAIDKSYVPPPSTSSVPISGVGLRILRHEISEEYTQVATNPEKGFHFHTGRPLAKMLGYPDAWIDTAPEESIKSFAGTGNPFSLGEICPGEYVVDVGCGAGFDSLNAARLVGPQGRVVGVDMTPAMLEKTRQATSKAGVDNVDFRQGYVEDLPLPDEWADVVISNGVVNLCPDKAAVFQEMYRVLKPGGRLQIGDILVQRAVPEEAKRDIDLWSG